MNVRTGSATVPSTKAETAIQAIGGGMMGEGRQVLTDDMRERIRDMLPGRKGDPGVTAADSRLFPEAVPWRTRTGPWRDLPERFGKWNSVSRRFRRRVEGGVSGRVFQRMSGKFNFGYVRVDGTVMRAHRKAAGGKGGLRARGSDARGEA